MTDFNFMNSPDFGAPGGIRANQAAQMNDLAMQGAQAELSMLPDKQAHMRAQTEHLKAQTGEIPSQIALRQAQASKAPAEILQLLSQTAENFASANSKQYGVERMKALSEALKGASANGGFAVGSDGKPAAASKTVAGIGMQLLQEGFYDSAKELLNQSNLLMGHETSAERLTFDKMKAEREADLKVYDLIGHEIPWVRDQQGLDALNQKIIKATGEPPPWYGNPYSPELVSGIEQSTMTLQQRTTLQLKQDAAKALERQREITNANAKLGRELEKVRIEDARKRADQAKKTGSVSAATQGETDNIVQLALENMPELKGIENKAALSTFASSVANDARQLRLKNPGFTPEQAQYKAFTERMHELEVSKGWGSKELKYNSSRIGTRETPIPFSNTEPPKNNKWYNVNGRIVQWVKNPATGKMQFAE